MSVFGTNRIPRYHDGTIGIAITNCVILKDEPEPDLLQIVSPITGHKSSVLKGYRWIFEVQVNLFKETSPSTTITRFLGDLGQTNHQIKRFGDASDYMKNASGNVYFTLTKVQPAFLTQARQYDILILRWESNDYIDLSYDV